MATTTKKPAVEEVVQEFPPVGKYRVRVLASRKGGRVLDVREYVSADVFEGFTRRGIRLDAAQADMMADIIKETLPTLRDTSASE